STLLGILLIIRNTRRTGSNSNMVTRIPVTRARSIPLVALASSLISSAALGEVWQKDSFYDNEGDQKTSIHTAATHGAARATASAVAAAPSPQDHANTDSDGIFGSRRLYGGAAVGVSRLKPETSNSQYEVSEDSDTGFKFMGGIELTDRLLLETSFNMLGSAQVVFSDNSTSEIDYDVLSFDALYKFPHLIGRLDAFGILGLTALSNDSDVPIEKDSSIQMKAGVALEYPMGGKAESLDTGSSASAEPSNTRATLPPAMADSDQDGIADNRDACPDTLNGLRVDDRGCSMFNHAFSSITFEVNSTKLTRSAMDELDILAKELKLVPHLRVEVQAHTDNVGTASYNVWLSTKRAEAIIDYLLLHGINTDRLKPKGYGETLPIASNDTESGRALNRRAEFKIIP
ncbi:MAG: OmpA family protein, partial [Gammaproteobacteria bacterium]